MNRQKYLYKLTDTHMQTYGGYQWEIGKEETAPGKGALCSKGWFHFYTHPLLAVVLNPIHAEIKEPRLFKAVCSGKLKKDHGLKVGVSSAVLVEEIPLPKITLTQKVAFGILCAKEVYKDEKWFIWADNWLSGKDRSHKTAYAAADADAAYAHAHAAAAAAADAHAATAYAHAATAHAATAHAATAAAAYAAAAAAYAAADAAAAYACEKAREKQAEIIRSILEE